MKKINILLLVLIIMAEFYACDLMSNIFGSDEAAITAFTEAGIVGEPVIDAENATITLAVEPMDLSTFDPEIIISEGASITEPELLTDGAEAIYTVIAENGDVVEWSVTITVQYGISFIIDGVKRTFIEGFINSDNEIFNAAVGNGVPGIDIQTSVSESYVLENQYDFADSNPTYDYIVFELSGVTTGNYSNEQFTFNDYYEDKELIFSTNFKVTEFGDKPGEDFKAKFNGEEIEDSNIKLTSGYAKLVIVEEYPF